MQFWLHLWLAPLLAEEAVWLVESDGMGRCHVAAATRTGGVAEMQQRLQVPHATHFLAEMQQRLQVPHATHFFQIKKSGPADREIRRPGPAPAKVWL